jgi:hypothetical protein
MVKIQRDKSHSKTSDTSKTQGKTGSNNFKYNPERTADTAREGNPRNAIGNRKS